MAASLGHSVMRSIDSTAGAAAALPAFHTSFLIVISYAYDHEICNLNISLTTLWSCQHIRAGSVHRCIHVVLCNFQLSSWSPAAVYNAMPPTESATAKAVCQTSQLQR